MLGCFGIARPAAWSFRPCSLLRRASNCSRHSPGRPFAALAKVFFSTLWAIKAFLQSAPGCACGCGCDWRGEHHRQTSSAILHRNGARVVPLIGAPEGDIAPGLVKLMERWRRKAEKRAYLLPHRGVSVPLFSKRLAVGQRQRATNRPTNAATKLCLLRCKSRHSRRRHSTVAGACNGSCGALLPRTGTGTPPRQ